MRKITLDNSRGDFSPRDQTYIKLLERYKPFWTMIDKARLDIGIKRSHYLTRYISESIYKKAQEYALDIIFIFNLPESWKHPLSDFIVMNKLYSPGTGLYLSGETRQVKVKNGSYKYGMPTALQITITQTLTLDDIYKWLRKHKSELQARLKSLPKKAARVDDDHIKLRLKILDLYTQSNKPKEIWEAMGKIYDDNNDPWFDDLTENKISKIITRFKKVVHRKA